MEINFFNKDIEDMSRIQKALLCVLAAPFIMIIMFALAVLMVALGIGMLALPLLVMINPKIVTFK